MNIDHTAYFATRWSQTFPGMLCPPLAKSKGDLGLTAEISMQSDNPALFQNLFGNGGWAQDLYLLTQWRVEIADNSCQRTFPISVLSVWSEKRKTFSRKSNVSRIRVLLMSFWRSRKGTFIETWLCRSASLKPVTIGGRGC